MSAPTGYGKTVLLATLFRTLEERGTRCVWVSLDDRDTDLDHLLAHLETALGAGAPGGVHLLEGEPRSHADGRIERILAALEAGAAETVLFVDNLGHCTSADVGRLLDAAVFGTRRGVHLVVSTSRLPGFDAARAKLEGRMREVSTAELSLSATETAELLAAAAIPVDGAPSTSSSARPRAGPRRCACSGSCSPRTAIRCVRSHSSRDRTSTWRPG